MSQPTNAGFHHTLCGCFSDCAQFCDTYWCPICQMGRQCAAADGQPHNCGCGMCCVALFFCEFFPMCLRCKVSDKYQLGESCCTSCICGIFCSGCSLCQTGRELNYRGVNPGGCCCVAPDYIDPNAEPKGQIHVQVNMQQAPNQQQGYSQQQQQPGNYQQQPNQPPSGNNAPNYQSNMA